MSHLHSHLGIIYCPDRRKTLAFPHSAAADLSSGCIASHFVIHPSGGGLVGGWRWSAALILLARTAKRRNVLNSVFFTKINRGKNFSVPALSNAAAAPITQVDLSFKQPLFVTSTNHSALLQTCVADRLPSFAAIICWYNFRAMGLSSLTTPPLSSLLVRVSPHQSASFEEKEAGPTTWNWLW